MNYKILIYGNGIYKEVHLEGAGELTIGTDKRCHVWLTGAIFERAFIIQLLESEGSFKAHLSPELKADDSEEADLELKLAKPITITYKTSGKELFKIEAAADFEDMNSDYHYQIDLTNTASLKLGTGPDADIRIAEDSWGIVELGLTKTIEGFSAKVVKGINTIALNGAPIKDENFTIQNNDFFSIGNVQFWMKDEKLFTEQNERLISKFNTALNREQNNQLKYPEFIRNVRLQFKQPIEKLEVLNPSSKPEEPEGNILAKILPTIIMMIIMTVMRVMIRSNVMYALYFVAMMAMSTFMTVIGMVQAKKKFKEHMEKREKIYNDYIETKEAEIIEKRQDEKLIAEKMNVLPTETIEQIENFDARLFEKNKTHEDFLDVPIGTGILSSVNQVEYRKQEYVETEDPFMDIPKKIHDKYEKLDNMPIVLHLGAVNAIGFLGTRNKLYQMTKNIMIQLAAQHFYQDVKFFAMMDEEDVKFFEWLRWLQNINDGNRRNILYDENSKKTVLEAIYTELSSRENMNAKEIEDLPHYVVFAYRSSYMSGHPITKYVKRAKELGFTFLFFEEYKELLHEACDELVCLDRETYNGFIQSAENAAITQNFEYAHLSGESVAKAALKLACVHVNEISLESTLTKNITLYQLLKVMSAYDLNIGQRWNNSNVAESMAAPLGVDSTGQLVYLDLHEKGHGPHGLVAGTTGSGKSELLQSYVLSMCVNFHPYEVSFVIIDFKGGGMANQFKNLPHLNGAITNIDGKQIDRSLMSIKAELLKRQRLFAEYNVNKIDDYIELFKNGKTPTPLPHLILIVDEFAELKSEQPEFMKELISAARIGRSLGMHLILATQKPAGVVNDQIWSNSRFKLCLKVQDKSDSNEVLKSPLAAEIREPGRCYLQVGNNEIFQLFQSAYSGASVNVEQMQEQKKYEICAVDFAGRRQVVYQQKPEKVKGSSETQLDAIVTYIEEFCKENNIVRQPDICLPPLAEVIDFPNKMGDIEETDVIVPIGIYDDPSNQLQDEISINITKNNTYIAGSSLSGKTNLLQTVIRGLCERYTADEICIYIIDFASMMLKNFENLNQVGGVVTISEDNKLKQLLEMVVTQIEERKEIFSNLGLSSFSAYREAGMSDLKQVVLFVENYSMFKSTYAEMDEVLSLICRDGISVGISVIVTNPMSLGPSLRMQTYFGEKISLNQNDKAQYSSLFDHCKLYPDENPGRGLIKRNNTIYEFQTYQSFYAKKEVEKVLKIREFVEETNKKNKGIFAKKIPTIPEIVSEDYVASQYDNEENSASYTIPIGLSYENIQPQYFDFTAKNLLGILGEEELGRVAFIKYILTHMADRNETEPVEFYILDGVKGELSEFENSPLTKKYTTSPSDIETIMSEVFEKAKSRYTILTQDRKDLKNEPLSIVIFNTESSIDVITDNDAVKQMHDILTKKVSGCKVCIMHANLSNTEVSYRSGAISKQLSEEGDILAFKGIRDIKIASPTISYKKANGKKMEFSDAFYIKNGAFTKVRVTTRKE